MYYIGDASSSFPDMLLGENLSIKKYCNWVLQWYGPKSIATPHAVL